MLLIKTILKSLGNGGEALKEVSGITEGLRKDLVNVPQTNLVDFQKLTYLYCKGLDSIDIERHGSKVANILFFQITFAKEKKLILLYLDKDGLVADEDVVDDIYPNVRVSGCNRNVQESSLQG